MHKYKVGDILTVNADTDIQVMITEIVNGMDYRIDYIDYPVEKSFLSLYSGSLFSKERIEQECTLLISNNSNVNSSNLKIDSEFKKECTCDSFSLFAKGCKCGAITPYKQRFG